MIILTWIFKKRNPIFTKKTKDLITLKWLQVATADKVLHITINSAYNNYNTILKFVNHYVLEFHQLAYLPSYLGSCAVCILKCLVYPYHATLFLSTLNMPSVMFIISLPYVAIKSQKSSSCSMLISIE